MLILEGPSELETLVPPRKGTTWLRNKGGRQGDFVLHTLFCLLNFEQVNTLPYKIIFKNFKCHETR